MMHSIKSQSPLKHDLKLGVDKPSCDKILEESGSFSKLIEKRTNSSQQLQTISPKLAKKTSNIKSKLTFKVCSNQAKLKKALKRKDVSTSVLINKKSKCEYDANNKAMKTQSKTPNDSKSIYFKDNASYVCKFCCRRFSSVDLLKEHILIHGNKSSYICHICNHEAACFSALMTHVVKHSRKSDKLENTNSDVNMFTPEKVLSSFQCNQCKLSFATSQKLSNHNCPSISFEKSEYMCAYCGQTSRSVEEYRTHVQSHSVTPFNCIHCKLKLPTKKHLDRHHDVCKKKPKLKFKCEKCSFACKGKRELNQHMKTCEPNSELPVFECSLCKLSFSVQTDLDAHILNCKGSTSSLDKDLPIDNQKKKTRIKKVSHLCDLCGETFTSKIAHEKHRKMCANSDKFVTAKESNVTFALCPTCGIQIDSLLLEEHIEYCCSADDTDVNVKSTSEHISGEMSPNKSFGGDMSPNKNSGGEMSPSKISGEEESPNTRRSARLVGRKIVFSSEEDIKVKDTYKPKQIKKLKVINKFRSRKGRQSKLGKENFMCHECNLTFCSKSTLLRHKRMHSGNPWYSCKYCGKYFFRKDVFNRHEMNVHNRSNKNIFCCYYCKLFFNAAVLLKEHVSTVHKENSLQTNQPLNPDEIDSHIEVKQEPDFYSPASDEADQIRSTDSQYSLETSSSKILNFPSYNKKCGICLQTFATTAEIEKHLFTHPLPNDSEITDKDTTNSLEVNVKTVSSDKHATDKAIDNYVTDDSKLLLNETIESSIKTSTNDIPVVKTTDILSNDIEKEKHLCKLCFKAFTGKTALSKHEAEQHVIIDWYQCLVCDACGTKRDMVEHMFTHMYQVGTFVVANNDFNNVMSYLQQSENEIQRQKGKVSSFEIDLKDNQCEETEIKDLDIELPKLTYHGEANLEIDQAPGDHSKINAINEVLVNPKSNQESATVEIFSNNAKSVECLDNSACAESESFDYTDSSSKSNFLQEIPTAHASSNLLSNSDDNLNDKDPFQELRRILKADNIPIKETSVVGDLSCKSDINNKVSNEEENSSDAQNYSQLRYLLEKSDERKTEATRADQYVEHSREHEDITKSSDVACSMRNLIQDLKSLNKLVSENVPNTDTIAETSFNSFNETDEISVEKLNETLSTSVDNLNDANKVADKLKVKLNEVDNFSVKKFNQLDKVNLKKRNESLKNINDANKFNFKSSNESDKTIFQNANLADKSSFKSNNESDEFNFKSKTGIDKGNRFSLNQVNNTCLKFDVNQSRGEFSEGSSPSLFHSNSSGLQKFDKLNNLFQPANPHSTILDFSDLLKISDSTNPNESNFFEISSQNSEMCNISTNFARTSADSNSHKSPVDLTYTTSCASASHVKEDFTCNKCSVKCKSYRDLIKHQCIKQLSIFEKTSPSSPKIKPLPFDFPRTTLDSSSDLVKKRQNALENPKHRSTAIFMCCVCSKTVNTSSILEQHYRAEHSGYSNNSFPNNKCIQCYQVLYGIADFMKHSLNCFKSNKSSNLSDSSSNQGLLQSLLLTPGSQAQENSLATSNVSQENDVSSFNYDSILNLSRNSFNS